MKTLTIGLTYDLRDDYLKEGYSLEETAEFDRPSTIEAIDETLRSWGHLPLRIGNIKALVKQLAAGQRWDLVFNICEGMFGVYSREAQVPALLEAYAVPYTFSDALTMSLSLKKDLAKEMVRSGGFRTPAFHLVRNQADIERVNLPFPLFVKPVAEGTSKGVTENSRITNAKDLKNRCLELLQTYQQPVLVENYCPGREFTIGMIGTGAKARYLGALEIYLKADAEQNAYTFYNKEYCEELVEYRLVEDPGLNKELEWRSLGVWRLLGCRDAGRIDFMIDSQGELTFIEINPLAGLNPEHSDLPILNSKLGRTYRQLIGEILESAAERVAL